MQNPIPEEERSSAIAKIQEEIGRVRSWPPGAERDAEVRLLVRALNFLRAGSYWRIRDDSGVWGVGLTPQNAIKQANDSISESWPQNSLDENMLFHGHALDAVLEWVDRDGIASERLCDALA